MQSSFANTSDIDLCSYTLPHVQPIESLWRLWASGKVELRGVNASDSCPAALAHPPVENPVQEKRVGEHVSGEVAVGHGCQEAVVHAPIIQTREAVVVSTQL